MIAVIDYRTGNIRSVMNALRRLGCDAELTSDPVRILSSDHVILPGVGDCSEAMRNLRESGLSDVIRKISSPVLGICVGMQLMCRRSEEGGTEGLGIFPTDVVRFVPEPGLKIPHMGWNSISNLKSELFNGVDEGSYVYYVHSYYPVMCDCAIATSIHGTEFCGALKWNNFYGCQFHPEKSSSVGTTIIENFLKL